MQALRKAAAKGKTKKSLLDNIEHLSTSLILLVCEVHLWMIACSYYGILELVSSFPTSVQQAFFCPSCPTRSSVFQLSRPGTPARSIHSKEDLDGSVQTKFGPSHRSRRERTSWKRENCELAAVWHHCECRVLVDVKHFELSRSLLAPRIFLKMRRLVRRHAYDIENTAEYASMSARQLEDCYCFYAVSAPLSILLPSRSYYCYYYWGEPSLYRECMSSHLNELPLMMCIWRICAYMRYVTRFPYLRRHICCFPIPQPNMP